MAGRVAVANAPTLPLLFALTTRSPTRNDSPHRRRLAFRGRPGLRSSTLCPQAHFKGKAGTLVDMTRAECTPPSNVAWTDDRRGTRMLVGQGLGSRTDRHSDRCKCPDSRSRDVLSMRWSVEERRIVEILATQVEELRDNPDATDGALALKAARMKTPLLCCITATGIESTAT